MSIIEITIIDECSTIVILCSEISFLGRVEFDLILSICHLNLAIISSLPSKWHAPKFEMSYFQAFYDMRFYQRRKVKAGITYSCLTALLLRQPRYLKNQFRDISKIFYIRIKNVLLTSKQKSDLNFLYALLFFRGQIPI